ncbi:MAG: hypothetical protein JWO32_2632 [Bacteroidetes bacterium]|nr:hypothetical protein [Bacteroidota bacterium]
MAWACFRVLKKYSFNGSQSFLSLYLKIIIMKKSIFKAALLAGIFTISGYSVNAQTVNEKQDKEKVREDKERVREDKVKTENDKAKLKEDKATHKNKGEIKADRKQIKADKTQTKADKQQEAADKAKLKND